MNRAKPPLILLLLVSPAILLWWQDRGAPADERVASATGTSAASPATPLAPPEFPPDSPDSNHPGERVAAASTVLDSRLEYLPESGRWQRVRLLRSTLRAEPLREVQEWRTEGGAWTCVRRDLYLADQLIVKLRDREALADFKKHAAETGMRIQSAISDGLFTVRWPEAEIDSIPRALTALAAMPELVATAEPDGIGFGAGVPNDSRFSEQWSLNNTGQSGGTPNADIDAPEFWDIMTTAPGIRIVVLDSGLNFTHPDLQGVAWTNPGEIAGDGIDNDGDGKTDDIRGWDFTNNDNDPTDDNGHGSNVSGIITANRNNATGVAGLIGGVKIIPCKILDASNSGLTSNLIAGLIYARGLGAPVFNMSLQNYPANTLLSDQITLCNDAGILLVICAGNQGTSNEVTANYPSSYPQPNIIAVGNHDRTDVRWSGSFNPSNYGAVSVDLFAPGRDILAPVLNGDYALYTGTSQAAPLVTAVAAAIKSVNPSWTAPQIKACILSSVVTRPAYSGLCATGGRLNAVNAIGYAIRQAPDQDSDHDGAQNLMEYLAGTALDDAASKPQPSSALAAGYFSLSIPRVIRGDAHFAVETSPDLENWTEAGVTDSSTPTLLMGSIPVTGGDKGFLRIRPVPSP